MAGNEKETKSGKPDQIPSNSAESGKARSKRNLKPPFAKGNKGGPGRPKGSRTAKDIYSQIGGLQAPKAIIEKLKAAGIDPTNKSFDEVIAYATAARAISNNGALQEYNDRRFGKAEQNINAKVFQIDANSMSDEVKALAEELGLIDPP